MAAPNILFLLVDCLRASAVFGDDRRTVTPTFDRLASEACCFSHLISVNSYTVPCMASIFTGLYPFAHGFRNQNPGKLPAELPTLASVLNLHGYSTYAEVCGPVREEVGLARGFQEFTWRDGGQSTLRNQWGEKLRQRLKTGGLKAPWFMYCHFWELHVPRQIAKRHRSERYGRDLYERAVSSFDPLLAEILEAAGEDTIVVITGDHGEIGESEAPGGRLGRLVRFRWLADALLPARWAKWGIQKATRIKNKLIFSKRGSKKIKGTVRRILTTGHGIHVVEPLIRVPLIVSGATDLPSGRVLNRVVSQVDIAPTLLDLAGLPDALPRCDGTSLLPLGHAGEMPARDVYFENQGSNAGLSEAERLESPWIAGLRSEQHKFWYRRFNPEKFPELYDIVADPAESRNLVDEMPELAAEMRGKIEALSPQDVDKPFSIAEAMSEEEAKVVTERLRDLGYVD